MDLTISNASGEATAQIRIGIELLRWKSLRIIIFSVRSCFQFMNSREEEKYFLSAIVKSAESVKQFCPHFESISGANFPLIGISSVFAIERKFQENSLASDPIVSRLRHSCRCVTREIRLAIMESFLTEFTGRETG